MAGRGQRHTSGSTEEDTNWPGVDRPVGSRMFRPVGSSVAKEEAAVVSLLASVVVAAFVVASVVVAVVSGPVIDNTFK